MKHPWKTREFATKKVATETRKVATKDAATESNFKGEQLEIDDEGGAKMQENRIVFDLESTPECKRMELVAIVHEEATKYIQQPGIQKKYEQWLEKRKAKIAATKEVK